jgi:hypothetical protein
MPHSFSYVWRYGVQRRRVDGPWRILLLAERCGVPCIRPGAASRVAVWELLPWSSCVRHFEGRADGRLAVAQQRACWRLVAPYSHNIGDGVAVPGMVAW